MIKHRKENQQNLIRLKKLIFNKKGINYYNSRKKEESKSDIINEYDKELYKFNINEKIKNIINNERKKLEESIDAYNKKLKSNFNKKDILFKNYNQNKYITGVDANKTKENDEQVDNMNIITDFYFKRENKI